MPHPPDCTQGTYLAAKIITKLYPGYDLAMKVVAKHDCGCDLAYKFHNKITPWDMFSRGYDLPVAQAFSFQPMVEMKIKGAGFCCNLQFIHGNFKNSDCNAKPNDTSDSSRDDRKQDPDC